jgi:uncharacterized protein YjbJ (UPF0337 family)
LIQINDDRWSAPQLQLLPLRALLLEDGIMDKDRVVGSAKQVKGAVKQAVGKAVGDTKLETEGKADKIAGKVQNAIGGVKDTLKGK